MPQLTHDTAEDGFHEIQLSGKQLVFLFMATTVVSVVIFLCGVLVGRGVRAEGESPTGNDAAAAAAPTASAPAEGAPTSAEAPTPVPDSELTYHDRLQQEKPKEELKPTATAQETKPTPPPPAPAAAAAPAPESAPDVPTAGKPGAWVIQVQALSNRGAAGSVVKRLITKGYPAFLLMPAKGAPAIYRVQIGRYSDRREAEQVARRLEKEEQFQPDIKR